MLPTILTFTGAAALSLILTYAIRSISAKLGAIDAPDAHRWHSHATPTMGGVAVVGSFFFTALAMTSPVVNMELFGAILVVFYVGIWDDSSGVSPKYKITGQMIAAVAVVWSGIVFAPTDYYALNVALTVFWIVGITNAFNLIDNMDGLCAGVGCIAALALAVHAMAWGDTTSVLIMVALSGACLGFLWHNFPRASIFMGDCGSMSIGFVIATMAVVVSGSYSTDMTSSIIVPVMILGVPIFDMGFVSVTRTIRGQSIARGGRDHTSHRLASLGFNEKQVALTFYGISLVLGAVSLLFIFSETAGCIPVLIAVIFFILTLGALLWRTTPDGEVPSGAIPTGSRSE